MSWKRVCVPCRKVYSAGRSVARRAPQSAIAVQAPQVCPVCRGDLAVTSYRWRPPKRRNDRAWRRIAAGDWMWENDPKDRRIREPRPGAKKGAGLLGLHQWWGVPRR